MARWVRGWLTMKLWIPVAVGALVVIAYALFYVVSLSEAEGATSIGIANAVGLVAVVVGLIAAGFILRRAAPRQ
jgi:hypothetical protein